MWYADRIFATCRETREALIEVDELNRRKPHDPGFDINKEDSRNFFRHELKQSKTESPFREVKRQRVTASDSLPHSSNRLGNW